MSLKLGITRTCDYLLSSLLLFAFPKMGNSAMPIDFITSEIIACLNWSVRARELQLFIKLPLYMILWFPVA